MSEEVEPLYRMKGDVKIEVHVKDLKDPNTFFMKLPFRPHRGDYINLDGQVLQWDNLEVHKTITEVALEAGVLSSSTIQVDEVVVFVYDVEQDECIVRAYATMRGTAKWGM